MASAKLSKIEPLILVVDMLDDSDHFIILSTKDPKCIGYRILKENIRIIESDIGIPNSMQEDFYRHRVGIDLESPCIKMHVTTVNAMIAEEPAMIDMYDEPVNVTSFRVEKAKEILAANAVHPQGCSEFVCKVLGVAWEDANSIMGSSPTYIGDNNNYPGLIPGDIVGWKVGGGSGHVAIYVGEPGTKFIDVREPGAKPRKVINGYGNQRPLYKSSKY